METFWKVVPASQKRRRARGNLDGDEESARGGMSCRASASTGNGPRRLKDGLGREHLARGQAERGGQQPDQVSLADGLIEDVGLYSRSCGMSLWSEGGVRNRSDKLFTFCLGTGGAAGGAWPGSRYGHSTRDDCGSGQARDGTERRDQIQGLF